MPDHASARARPRPLSLAALTVLEVPPADGVRIAAQCGYSHVGLRPVAATAEEPHWPILTDPMLFRELVATLDGEGVCVLDVEIVRVRPDMDWDQIAAVLNFAQRLGCARLLVADNDPEPARSRDTLARIAAMGAPYGVTPHLEFMPWTCAPNLAAARARVAGIDNAALLIDAFHLVRSGGTIAEIARGDPAVGYLQLCDIAGPIPDVDTILREARSNRLFPGEGSIDLIGLLRAVPDVPISLEIPADRLRDNGVSALSRAQQAFDAVRQILARVDDTAAW